MYPSQAAVFGLTPRVVTLRESAADGAWRLDPDELRRARRRRPPARPEHRRTTRPARCSAAVSWTRSPRSRRDEDLVVVTDEIYEHIVFDGARHRSLATLPGMRERDRRRQLDSRRRPTQRAGGVGWVLSPPHLTPGIRAVHDTLVIQAPTPLQKGGGRAAGAGRRVLPRVSPAPTPASAPSWAARCAAPDSGSASRAGPTTSSRTTAPSPGPRRSRPAGRRAAPDRARRRGGPCPATTSTPAAPPAPATCVSPSAAAATPSPRPRAVCGG